MAKQAKPGSNTIDPELSIDFVRRYEEFEAEKASERGKFMKICRDIGDSQKSIFTEAKARGVSVKALRVEINKRKRDAKTAQEIADLEEDDAAAFEQIDDACEHHWGARLDEIAEEKAARRAATKRANTDAVATLV